MLASQICISGANGGSATSQQKEANAAEKTGERAEDQKQPDSRTVYQKRKKGKPSGVISTSCSQGWRGENGEGKTGTPSSKEPVTGGGKKNAGRAILSEQKGGQTWGLKKKTSMVTQTL